MHVAGEPPLVSIGVPVLNGADGLDRCLHSLRDQTWPNLEIVVSDNASSDATPSIIEAHRSADRRISVSRQPQTVSVDENFDSVLRAARGELFMWAAHDDCWQPDHVERLARLLVDDDGAVIASGVPQVLADDGTPGAVYGRLAELAGHDELVGRVLAFIEQPEAEGKANLFYGLFRRETLLEIDLVRFLRADARRIDHHVILAALGRGRLQVDRELVFGKTVQELGTRSRREHAASGLANSVRALRWIGAYRGVARDMPALTAGDLAAVDRAIRRRQRALLWDRVRAGRRVFGR